MGILLVIAVVAIVVWLLLLRDRDTGRGIVNTSATTAANIEETPLEILNKRYARGQIDRAEYEERKRDLV